MAGSHLSRGSHQRRAPTLPYQRGRTTRRNTRKRGLPRVGLRLRDRLAFVVVFVSVGVRSSGSVFNPLVSHHSLALRSSPTSSPATPCRSKKQVSANKGPQARPGSPGLDKRADRAIINGRANAYYAPPHARGFSSSNSIRRPSGNESSRRIVRPAISSGLLKD